jgi:SWI/SNF-related matrix-associated actin-dependent regulator 1 of chromatin subfamily A
MNELKNLTEEKFMIRRIKSEVLSQLPAKLREMIILDPTLVKSKSKVMQEKAQFMTQLRDKSKEHAMLLEWFHLTSDAKVNAVCEYIKDLLESDKKFLLFAHHQTMIKHLSELLEKQKVKYILIDGKTSSLARKTCCDEFQTSDQIRVALLSITAANTGLTLTAAQLVVFAELFWNPGVLTQAEDRAHRIGQTDSVTIQYLVALNTADDKLWPMIQKKLDVLNEAGLSKDNFSKSDSRNVQQRVIKSNVASKSDSTTSRSDNQDTELIEDIEWDLDDKLENDMLENINWDEDFEH